MEILIPENPAQIVGYVLVVLITLLGKSLFKVVSGKNNVALEKVKFDKKKFEQLTEELSAALKRIDELVFEIEDQEKSIVEKDLLIQEQQIVIQYSKILMNMLYKQMQNKEETDTNMMLMLEQVKDIFDKH